MRQTPPEIDIDAWERRCDGLIFFDLAGNFTGCSPKMERLAGSVANLRAALEKAAWPRDFARASGNFRIEWTLPLAGGEMHLEAGCVPTTAGFVAAVTIKTAVAGGNAGCSCDAIREIFEWLITERRAISRYLHAVLTQDLVALALALGQPREGDPAITNALASVDRCCRSARALSYVLAPPPLLDSSLIETIRWYGDVLQADAGVDFAIEAGPLPGEPPHALKELLFAGLQSLAAAAIWNTKNARIRVTVAHERSILSMRVDCDCDSGEFAAESPLIRERARSLGGSSQFTRSPGKWALDLAVPWEAE